MERLHFGARARRRARLHRWSRWAAVASFAMMVLGIGGVWTTGGLGFLTRGSDTAKVGAIVPVNAVPRDDNTPDTFELKSDELNDRLDRLARLERRAKRVPEDAVTGAPVVVEEEEAVEEVVEEEAVVAAPPPAGGSIAEIIYAAAARHGVDGGYLLSIAQCESGLDPNAVNAAGYYGLFQFSESTWAAYGSGSIFDPAAQADATARMIAAGGSGHWPNCG